MMLQELRAACRFNNLWVKAVLAQCLASLFECGVAYLHLRIGFDISVERHDTTEQPSKCWRMIDRQESQVAD